MLLQVFNENVKARPDLILSASSAAETVSKASIAERSSISDFPQNARFTSRFCFMQSLVRFCPFGVQRRYRRRSGTKFAKGSSILFRLSLCLISWRAEAADWYVRSGTAGNGISWVDAWRDVTNIAWSSIQPGDTIWIAGGNYGALNVGQSGRADTPAGRIFVKRATSASHGSDFGWSNAYNSQVNLSSISWSSLNIGSYVTIDGQVDNGISIAHSDGDDSKSITFDRGATHVTLRYLDIVGPGDAAGHHHTGDDRGIDITAWNGSSYDAVDFLIVQFSLIHGACTQVWNMNASNGIWEHNKFYNSTEPTGGRCHPNIFATASSSNVTFRYNDVYNYSAEGIMILDGGHGSLYVYGNLWYSGRSHARVLETQGGMNGPVYFFNNTVDELWWGILASHGGIYAPGSQGRNNIWWNMPPSGLPDEDYDLCSRSGCPGSHSISNGTDPFINHSDHDYHIVSTVGPMYPRNKGVNLGLTFIVSKIGVSRGADGAWDIGAFEFPSSSSALSFPRHPRNQ